jgi:hypothetical protein
MKKLFIVTCISLILGACTNSRKQEKDLLDEILKVHDRLMSQDEQLMKNKMLLDSLIKMPAKDTAAKANMKALSLKLKASEESMENWMHNFEPDVTSKSHDEILKYYNEQKKGITAVDSQMNVAISESNKYLSSLSK